MTYVWLLESGDRDDPAPVGVYLDEAEGLRKFEKRRKRARKATGLKINRYTWDDGTHESAWGSCRLLLRPVKVP